MHRITVRDVARVAGMHFSTVSLALRDSPRLSAATRGKIQAIARELGYQPDPMLTALNAYRRGKHTPAYQATIAWINNWPRREQLFEKSEFLEYFQGASERAERLGYLLEEFWLHEPGMSPQKLCRILRARNIQSILMAPQPKPNISPAIDYSDFSAACFGYSMQPAVLNVVASSQFHAMSLMLRHLLGLGYRRLGLCIPTEMHEKAEGNYHGSLLLMQVKLPASDCVPPLLLDDDRREISRGLLAAWLTNHRPDAVIALGYMAQRIEDLGLSIPKDVGFANLSIPEGDAYWSGVHQNNRLIGRKAVDVVVGMVHRGEHGIPEVPVCVQVESTWIPGQTLRRQNGDSERVASIGQPSLVRVAKKANAPIK